MESVKEAAVRTCVPLTLGRAPRVSPLWPRVRVGPSETPPGLRPQLFRSTVPDRSLQCRRLSGLRPQVGTMTAPSSPSQTPTFPEKTLLDLRCVHRGLLLHSELSGSSGLITWCSVNFVLVFCALHSDTLKPRVCILLFLYAARTV